MLAMMFVCVKTAYFLLLDNRFTYMKPICSYSRKNRTNEGILEFRSWVEGLNQCLELAHLWIDAL